MSATSDTGTYRPYDDLRLYPGIHLSEERRRQLDDDAVEPDELGTEDIVYKLSRMVTGTFYSLVASIEERWGKEAARETVTEWGRQRARENLSRWMRARGVDRLTPELWARFQDYRHIISGPLHAPSFTRYEGDSDLVVDRKACLFHDGRPEGMDSYCAPSCDGMFAGYAEASSDISSENPMCMSRGTSDSGCQVRFSVRPQD